jgi:hypothetical protein
MSRHGGPGLQRSAARVGAALLLFGSEPDLFSAGNAVRDAIAAGLPKYDPAARASPPPAKPAENATPKTDASPAYGVKAGSTEAPKAAENAGPILALPRMEVHAKEGEAKPEPALQLPRIVVRPPAGKDLPAEKFETPAARDERLVKKHLNVFDRVFLNRFTLPLFGIAKEKRARDAEAVEQTAKQLDQVADILELTQQEQGNSAEAKKLQELYREVFMARPMGTQRGR